MQSESMWLFLYISMWDFPSLLFHCRLYLKTLIFTVVLWDENFNIYYLILEALGLNNFLEFLCLIFVSLLFLYELIK